MGRWGGGSKSEIRVVGGWGGVIRSENREWWEGRVGLSGVRIESGRRVGGVAGVRIESGRRVG